MNDQERLVAKITKRMTEAIGYLELGLANRAVAELDALGDPGVFRPAAEVIRGEIVRRSLRLCEDAVPVEVAAPFGPEPVEQHVWLTLAACCHAAGHEQAVTAALRQTRREGPLRRPR
jgi:hypothetical protein